MPIPTSSFQKIKLIKYIEKLPNKKRKIAINIYDNYWNDLIIQNDFLLDLCPSIIISGFITMLFFDSCPGIIILLIGLITFIISIFISVKIGLFKTGRYIDSNEEKKKKFEKLISNPETKEIYEEMRKVFNGY
ncbi:MAG: hypothetical protein WCO35_03060 [Candidatus Nomurabacteria bacterium]